MLIGPVVGIVSGDSARVLLEVDRDAEVTLFATLCPKID